MSELLRIQLIMTIDSNFRIPFQDFAINAAKKLGLTAEQLRTFLEPDIHKISVFFQTQAQDIKKILDNPHISADGFEAEYLRLQKEMDRFVDFIHQDVQQRLEDQHLNSTQVGRFVDSLMDEAKNLTGSSRLIEQLSSRGKSSIFYLASQKRALLETSFPPHPVPEPLLTPSPPSNPDLMPLQDSCSSVLDLLRKYASLIGDNPPYKLSDGAKNLIRTLMVAIENAVLNNHVDIESKPDNVWSYLLDAVPQSDDVYWRYKGLTQVEYYFINNCASVADRYGHETWPLPNYLANDLEGKIADLIGFSKQEPDGHVFGDFLTYLEEDPDFTPNSPLSFIQKKARLFSMREEFSSMTPDAKNQFATFAGITTSPLINYLDSMKDQLPNSTPLFDMMIQEAKNKGITNLASQDDYVDFMNDCLKSFHGGVDVYLYTGITPENLEALQQAIPGIQVPPKAFTDDIYDNLINLIPELKGTQLYTDLMNKLAAICQDDSPQDVKPQEFQSYLYNLYLTNDPKLTSLSEDVQTLFLQTAGTNFQNMYSDIFDSFLKDNAKFHDFIQDFTFQLGPDPMSPEDFRKALADFITSKTNKEDIYMLYPTIKPDDLKNMADTLFPDWKLPVPDLTPTDYQYQQTHERAAEYAVPGSEDETVFSAVLAAIAKEGSDGSISNVQSWVANYLQSGMDNYKPTELTVSWLQEFFKTT